MASLSDPRWTLSMKFDDPQSDSTKTRSISGINYRGDESNAASGYDATQIANFTAAYATLCNGTIVGRQMQAQYNLVL